MRLSSPIKTHLFNKDSELVSLFQGYCMQELFTRLENVSLLAKGPHFGVYLDKDFDVVCSNKESFTFFCFFSICFVCSLAQSSKK